MLDKASQIWSLTIGRESVSHGLGVSCVNSDMNP